MTYLYEESRRTIASLLGASSPEEVVFTSGTTQGLNALARALCPPVERRHDGRFRLFVTPLEHHANLVPWQEVAKENGYQLGYLPFLASGEIDLERLPSFLDETVAVVALHHVSHVTGGVLPVEVLSPLIRSSGALSVLDAAQSIGHLPVSLPALGCDFCCFSGHKVYGPTGVGVCWGRQRLWEEMRPWSFGGHMVDQVTLEGATYQKGAARFEAGTPPFVQAIGMSHSLAWLSSLNLNEVHRYEQELMLFLIESLSRDHRIRLLGNPSRRGSLVSMCFDGQQNLKLHPFDVATLLGLERICVRSGHLCAQPAMSFFGTTSCLRVSLGVYTEKSDLEHFMACLLSILDRLS
ncbi:Cysteine desulfurase, SufS subfamily [Candidatus Similichlamydia laticola]|uniref:Cysteine desulfurase, SufS subfamily n=2 Tax=Candidatus Similichlamydia laticola TaxID=2170265 RepID=A0A369KB64_9BACT|nr:Cysteine desulfurase, SufS subfamily [Candidatus Similichlamydia laticola]